MPWECLARDKELASDLVRGCTFEPLARPPCGPEVVRIRGKLSLSIDLYSLKSQTSRSRGTDARSNTSPQFRTGALS